MLTKELIEAVRQYAEKMTRPVTLVLNTGEHEKRAELVDFLSTLAETSEYILFEQRAVTALRSPISFQLEAAGNSTGIVFSGIPGGHEFSSLILALIQSGGHALKIDQGIQNQIVSIDQPLNFEVFISLSCHNCPDVVQFLNQFALLNEQISSEMIDGGLFQALVDERNIQGVPSVYLNGEPFANGKIDAAMLFNKLQERYPQQVVDASAQVPAKDYDITVIGGGPAGVSAAIYCARKGLNVTVIADRIGGQVQDTMDIENFISLPKTTGPELSKNLLAHLQDYDIDVREAIQVQSMQPQGPQHEILLSTNETIVSKAVIIATGAKWRELGVPGERENIGQGVAYCPHCDGPFFKGKDVAVIGGGNSGVEAALDLSGIVKSVLVLEFMPDLKADKVLIDKLKARDNVSVVTSAQTLSINAGADKVQSITYKDRDSGAETTQDLAGVFVQIGLLPNSDFLGDTVQKTAYGEIIVDQKCATNVAGIFACGDVTTVPYKQIGIAVGEGSKAALAAYDYLLLGQHSDSAGDDQQAA